MDAPSSGRRSMRTCCCVASGEVIESWDLPPEGEHDTPEQMSVLAPPSDVIREERMTDASYASSSELRHVNRHRDSFLRVGAVAVPPGTTQGLQLLHSLCVNLVVICNVAAGPWQRWNEAHPQHQVRPGDVVVEVNGRSGNQQDIIKEMTAVSNRSRLLTMLIRRPVERVVRVPRPLMEEESASEASSEQQGEGRTLGLLLHPVEHVGLFIDAIRDDGAVDLWNRAHEGQEVRVLDCIIEVNGVRGNPLQLVEAMKQPGDCELVLRTHSL